MNYSQMIKTVYKIHKKTGMNYFLLIKDIIKCGTKYQAGYMDYALFEMYKLTDRQRETMLTRGRNNDLIRKYNNSKYKRQFSDKGNFNIIFADYVKRDWLIIDNNKYEFLEFIKDKKEIIAKPRSASCGTGIEKVTVDSSDELYDYLNYEKLFLVEEVIKQHRHMSQLCPTSVNTIRFITIYSNDQVHIIAAYLRIGNKDIVDNFNHGGMVVPIDIESGYVNDVAVDKNGNVYENHPVTHTKIRGFKIPLWKESIELVHNASKVIPEVSMVGWDVAIGEKEPMLVEGNEFPGHDIYQLPVHCKDGIGIYPKFQMIEKINN